jgi:hypothetical protein
MCRACSTHGRDEEYITRFGWEGLKEKGRHLEEFDVGRWEDKNKMDLREIGWVGMGDLAEDSS